MNVRRYFIGKFEVTVAQFAAFVKDAGHQVDARSLEGPVNHPVRWVSWHDAVAYCGWVDREVARVRRHTVRVGAPPAQHRRQPALENTPAERRGVGKSCAGTDGRTYPWGDQLAGLRANYDNAGGPVAVGSYPAGASPYGVLDLAGNVLEWTRSVWAWETPTLRAAGGPPTQVRYPYRRDDGREHVKDPMITFPPYAAGRSVGERGTSGRRFAVAAIRHSATAISDFRVVLSTFSP